MVESRGGEGQIPAGEPELPSLTGLDNPRSGGPRARRGRTVLALIVVVIVVSAGAVYYSEREISGPSPGYPAPPRGWTTFLGAWADVSSAFSALVNGSWTVHFAEGVAADGHWSPPAALWALYGPGSWVPCEDQLSGVSTLTFWNASEYPSTQSSNDFTSGAAPLWTFVFNGTHTLTFVASWFLGRVSLNAALGQGSPCSDFSIFGASTFVTVDPNHELDSNAIAAEVQAEDEYFSQRPPGVTGPTPMPVPPAPGVALYFPGHQLLPSELSGRGLWTAAYWDCGLDGEYGTSASWTGYLLNATTVPSGHTYQWFGSAGGEPCYDTEYLVSLSRTGVVGAPLGSGEYLEWRINVSFMTSAVPPAWNLTGLTTSLFGSELRSGSPPFSVLPSARALCGSGSRNLTSCPAPSNGWYAVLLAPNGTWLDSYPTSPNGTNWSVPGLHIQSGDLVAFVASQGYGSTDSLELTGGNEPLVFGGDYLEGP